MTMENNVHLGLRRQRAERERDIILERVMIMRKLQYKKRWSKMTKKNEKENKCSGRS